MHRHRRPARASGATIAALVACASVVLGMLAAVPAQAEVRAPALSLDAPDRVTTGTTIAMRGVRSAMPVDTAVRIQRKVGSEWRTVANASSGSRTFTAYPGKPASGSYRFRAVSSSPAATSNVETVLVVGKARLSVSAALPERFNSDQRMRVSGSTDAADGSTVTIRDRFSSSTVLGTFTVVGGAFAGRLESPGTSHPLTATVEPADDATLANSVDVAQPQEVANPSEYGRLLNDKSATRTGVTLDVPIRHLYPGDRFSLRKVPFACAYYPTLIYGTRRVPLVDGVWEAPAGSQQAAILRFYPCDGQPIRAQFDVVNEGYRPVATAGRSAASAETSTAVAFRPPGSAGPARAPGERAVGVVLERADPVTRPDHSIALTVSGATNAGPGQQVYLQRRTTTSAWVTKATLVSDSEGRVGTTLPGAFSGVAVRLKLPKTSAHPAAESDVLVAAQHSDINLPTAEVRYADHPLGGWGDHAFTATAGQVFRATYSTHQSDFGDDYGCVPVLYRAGTWLTGTRTSTDDGEVTTFEVTLPTDGTYSFRAQCRAIDGRIPDPQIVMSVALELTEPAAR